MRPVRASSETVNRNASNRRCSRTASGVSNGSPCPPPVDAVVRSSAASGANVGSAGCRGRRRAAGSRATVGVRARATAPPGRRRGRGTSSRRRPRSGRAVPAGSLDGRLVLGQDGFDQPAPITEVILDRAGVGRARGGHDLAQADGIRPTRGEELLRRGGSGHRAPARHHGHHRRCAGAASNVLLAVSVVDHTDDLTGGSVRRSPRQRPRWAHVGPGRAPRHTGHRRGIPLRPRVAPVAGDVRVHDDGHHVEVGATGRGRAHRGHAARRPGSGERLGACAAARRSSLRWRSSAPGRSSPSAGPAKVRRRCSTPGWWRVAPIAIAGSVVRRRVIDLRTILAALCVYVLLGMLWAFVYIAVGEFGPSPFFAQPVDPTSADFLYFSFMTQLTVGYGDLTAAANVGRAVRCSRRCWARSTWSPWSRCWCPAWHRVRQATVPSRTTDGILAVDARDRGVRSPRGRGGHEDDGRFEHVVAIRGLDRTDEIRWLSPSTC